MNVHMYRDCNSKQLNKHSQCLLLVLLRKCMGVLLGGHYNEVTISQGSTVNVCNLLGLLLVGVGACVS